MNRRADPSPIVLERGDRLLDDLEAYAVHHEKGVEVLERLAEIAEFLRPARAEQLRARLTSWRRMRAALA